jgi:hypothetical protein
MIRHTILLHMSTLQHLVMEPCLVLLHRGAMPLRESLHSQSQLPMRLLAKAAACMMQAAVAAVLVRSAFMVATERRFIIG